MTGEEIAESINKIIRELQKTQKDFKEEAINWGDLRCVSVVQETEIYPSETMRMIITIEETSPDSCKLFEAIANRFFEKHKKIIEVRGEW